MPLPMFNVTLIKTELHVHLILLPQQLLVLLQLLLLVPLHLKLVNAYGIANHQQELLHQLLHAQ